MLRFFSNYIFQNESQAPDTSPTTSSELQQGPNSSDKPKSHDVDKPPSDKEFMDLEMRENGDEDDEEEEDDDDWVLIGGEAKRKEEEEAKVEQPKGDIGTVQCQPVNLVAASDTPPQGETEEEEESDEEEDEDEEEEEAEGLMWENKLIEHPSMSVYVDLATSIQSSNAQTASCVSLSSICPASSPGESVIVLEQPESDVGISMDESMDLENTESPIPPKKSTAPAPAPLVQNGRRKKGHYPCSSSNSSQLPRRAHLRSCGGVNTSTVTTGSPTSQSASFVLGATQESSHHSHNHHETTTKKSKRSSASAAANATTPPTCIGLGGMVANGSAPVPPTANGNGMVNKNLKLIEMFPTASKAAQRRHRRTEAALPKGGPTHRGHFLQEGKRRQDLQSYRKHSYVNNDRRSAQQRRVQKMPQGGGQKM